MIFGNPAKFFFLFTALFTINGRLQATPVSNYPTDPEPYDIVISEIMADPSPAQGLPECEFIELHNRSAGSINLSGWILTIGKSVITLPDTAIMPGGYVVVTDSSHLCIDVSGLKIIAINMPHINNTGQVITLRHNSGAVIHSVNFSSDWYNNEVKDDGGWSVEMIDTENPCAGRNNWLASNDISGGSPGRKNSISRLNPDKSPPFIMHASTINDTAILLHFNESLYYPDLDEPHLFSVDQGFYHPEAVNPIEPAFTDIILNYRGTFKPGTVYHITVLGDIKDCAGNHPSDGLMARFAETQPAGLTDVIINEVLFEAGDRIEFVELYNRSEKVIDLAALDMALAEESNVIYKSFRISDIPASVFPGEYRVICRHSDKLTAAFPDTDPITLTECENMFILPDNGGLLVLNDTSGQLIDECFFSNSLHYSLLTSTAGITIERNNPDMPSADPANWHSASYSSGYGSPGKSNSQHYNHKEIEFRLSSDVLSPDGDGKDDEVQLYFNMGEPGWTGSVKIYSLKGQEIKTIASNELLGADEIYIWDGSTDSGDTASPGIYLVYAEFFSSKGKIKNFKKVVSVVRK